MNNQTLQYKPFYYLQRPHSPNPITHSVSNKNAGLTMSIGANQSANSFFPINRSRPQISQPVSDSNLMVDQTPNTITENSFKSINKQNAFLREENQQLRRQLARLKRQNLQQNARSSEKYEKYSRVPAQSYNDLRGTIKKQTGEIKQMRIKLDMLSKQCQMYEQIIEKMDQKMKKITHDNNKKNSQIEELQSQVMKLDQLKEKASQIMRYYNDVESKFNNHQLQWMKWKQSWLGEKECYLSRIKQLQKK